MCPGPCPKSSTYGTGKQKTVDKGLGQSNEERPEGKKADESTGSCDGKNKGAGRREMTRTCPK